MQPDSEKKPFLEGFGQVVVSLLLGLAYAVFCLIRFGHWN